MNKITFSQIDAKECPIVGLDHERPRSLKNGKLMVDAELEYLRGLRDLQDKIRNKYTTLLEEEPTREQTMEEEDDVAEAIDDYELSKFQVDKQEKEDLYDLYYT